MKRNDDEQAIMDHIGAAYRGILELNGGLSANEAELAHAVHVLQMFVMMSVLHRCDPDEWNNWFQQLENYGMIND